MAAHICRHQTSSSQRLKKEAFKQQATNIIHRTKNKLNEKNDDNELKTPPGSKNAQLFLSCGLDSLKVEKDT